MANQENSKTPLRYRMSGDLQWQYTERPEQAEHADEVQILQPLEEWMSVTPELLFAIEGREHGRKFWLAAPGVEQAFVGTYEWRQGRSPHGFVTEEGARWSAEEITHVMRFRPPALPAV